MMSSSFERHDNEGHSSYLLNQQVALPGPYVHGDSTEFSANGSGSGSYNFSHNSFNSYLSQFSPTYSQPSNLTSSAQQLPAEYASSNSSQALSCRTRLQHYPPQYITQPHFLQVPKYLPLRDTLEETEIENQESWNESSILSEPVMPPLDGFPDVRQFDQLMNSYVDDLSVKKQDKALIHARRARNIKTVLMDPKDTAIESAQFRFWVKKMFKLQVVGIGTPDCRKMVCHEEKPVAIREKLFKILTKAHQQCQHGGRDKTSAQVRRIYSWVPKELISRFVKICPTCQVRRGGLRLTPPDSRRSSPRLELGSRSPSLISPPVSRRESAFSGQIPLDRPQVDYFAQVHNPTGWTDNHPDVQGRSIENARAVHSCSEGVMSAFPDSISTTLDPFASDLSIPSSQLSYGTRYISANEVHETPTHRDF